MLFMRKEDKKYFIYTSIKVLQKDIQETNNNSYLQGKVNKSCCTRSKEVLRPMRSHHKDTGASFKGFPLANLRQFEYKKEQ